MLGRDIDAALGEKEIADFAVPSVFKSQMHDLRYLNYANGTLIQKTIIENILAEWEEFVKEKAIPFCEAVTLLSGKLNTPKETIEHELAGWASDGDLKAYASRTLAESKEFNATYIDKYGEYLEKSKGIGFEYLPLMQGLYFRQSDLETFQPKDRYITGADLIKRWIGRLGSKEGVINKLESETGITPTWQTVFQYLLDGRDTCGWIDNAQIDRRKGIIPLINSKSTLDKEKVRDALIKSIFAD